MQTKPWYQSLTILFAIAAAAVSAAQQLLEIFPSGEFHKVLSGVVIVAMFVLRFRTCTGIQGSNACK